MEGGLHHYTQTNFKDDTNSRTIHKLRTKNQLSQHTKNSWRGRWDETEQESLTTCPLCTSTDKKKWRRALLTSWESAKLLKKFEKKLS